MILRAVLLFLIFIAVLAMLGKLHWIGGKRVSKCRACGRYLIGKGPCTCGKGGA
ncbi:MAG: hypothetical protein AAFV87_09190 [Pseudomonadota bacterium]